VGQSFVDLLGAQDVGSDSRKLDRQRQTVQPAAHIHDGRPIGIG
jgi:hypothetical protein